VALHNLKMIKVNSLDKHSSKIINANFAGTHSLKIMNDISANLSAKTHILKIIKDNSTHSQSLKIIKITLLTKKIMASFHRLVCLLLRVGDISIKYNIF